MKILGLYNNECALELFDWINNQGHEVLLCNKPIDIVWCQEEKFDLAASYTYRYILEKDILDLLNNNAVNLHNSVLPWNRGADPNLWSIANGTPRGVILHYMDAQLDKGYIIVQELVDDIVETDKETLTSSYYSLDYAAKNMFKKAFKYYDYWPSLRKKCIGDGSYHSLKDGKAMKEAIESYDITIKDFSYNLKSSHIKI